MSLRDRIAKVQTQRLAGPVGRVYGRLTVLSDADDWVVEPWGRRRVWTFGCACGEVVRLRVSDVNSGKTRSCGCLRRQVTAKRNTTEKFRHGHHGTRIYTTWSRMKARCNNPCDIGYRFYGGRGVKVCVRWIQFANFFTDMGESPGEAYSIDRIDPKGDYEPGNCQWILRGENSRRATKGKKQGPFTAVENIEIRRGPRGGRYWLLTLECGHVTTRSSASNFTPRTAPQKVRCIICKDLGVV